MLCLQKTETVSSTKPVLALALANSGSNGMATLSVTEESQPTSKPIATGASEIWRIEPAASTPSICVNWHLAGTHPGPPPRYKSSRSAPVRAPAEGKGILWLTELMSATAAPTVADS